MPLLILVVALSPVALGLYLLIVGQVDIGRFSLPGPLARLMGAFLILCPIMGLPLILRWLVGMTMSLGH
jgi:hypothetical protein